MRGRRRPIVPRPVHFLGTSANVPCPRTILAPCAPIEDRQSPWARWGGRLGGRVACRRPPAFLFYRHGAAEIRNGDRENGDPHTRAYTSKLWAWQAGRQHSRHGAAQHASAASAAAAAAAVAAAARGARPPPDAGACSPQLPGRRLKCRMLSTSSSALRRRATRASKPAASISASSSAGEPARGAERSRRDAHLGGRSRCGGSPTPAPPSQLRGGAAPRPLPPHTLPLTHPQGRFRAPPQ